MSDDELFYQEETQISPDPPQHQIKYFSHRHFDYRN